MLVLIAAMALGQASTDETPVARIVHKMTEPVKPFRTLPGVEMTKVSIALTPEMEKAFRDVAAGKDRDLVLRVLVQGVRRPKADVCVEIGLYPRAASLSSQDGFIGAVSFYGQKVGEKGNFLFGVTEGVRDAWSAGERGLVIGLAVRPSRAGGRVEEVSVDAVAIEAVRLKRPTKQ